MCEGIERPWQKLATESREGLSFQIFICFFGFFRFLYADYVSRKQIIFHNRKILVNSHHEFVYQVQQSQFFQPIPFSINPYEVCMLPFFIFPFVLSEREYLVSIRVGPEILSSQTQRRYN